MSGTTSFAKRRAGYGQARDGVAEVPRLSTAETEAVTEELSGWLAERGYMAESDVPSDWTPRKDRTPHKHHTEAPRKLLEAPRQSPEI